MKAQQVLGASLSFPDQPQARSGGSFDVISLLVILGCALGLSCFAIAMIPARAVPWPRAAVFVAERQLDVTIIGLTLLLAALFAFVFSRAT